MVQEPKKFVIKKKTAPKIRFGEKKAAPKITIGEKKPAFTIKAARKIKDVPAFHREIEIKVETREDLREVAEEPVLKACQQLFDKNIQTLESGCNGENCSNRAYIIINYDTLDANNKRIADDMVKRKTAEFRPKSDVCDRNYFNKIYLEVPTSPEETVGSVEKKLQRLTQQFVPQRKIVKNKDMAEIIAMHERYFSRNK